MKVTLIEDDEEYERISYQESPEITCIVSILNNLNDINLIQFISNLIKSSNQRDIEYNYKNLRKTYDILGFHNEAKEIYLNVIDICKMGESIFKDYKGAIPEKLCYEKIKNKFSTSDCQCERECKIKIDKRRNKWESNKVDVAGWSENLDRGESYECKFSAGGRMYVVRNLIPQLENLIEIREKSERKISPYIFTFAEKENYENYLKEKIPYCDIEVIGSDEIITHF